MVINVNTMVIVSLSSLAKTLQTALIKVKTSENCATPVPTENIPTGNGFDASLFRSPTYNNGRKFNKYGKLSGPPPAQPTTLLSFVI